MSGSIKNAKAILLPFLICSCTTSGGIKTANAADKCNVTIDSHDPRSGLVRAGGDFAGVVMPPATGSIQTCAAVCCETPGCVAWSYNAPWTLPQPFFSCTTGTLCCALKSTVAPLVPNKWDMNITSGLVSATDQMINSGTPSGITHSFDCTMRQLALEYARTLRPDKGSFQAVYDALQLWACNSSSISRNADTAAPRATPKAHSFPAGSSANQQHQRKHQHQHRRHQKQQGHEFFVAVTGSDAAAGTVASPFATPQRGVTACRTSIPTPSSTAGCTVTLREGIFYLSDSALALGPEDSYITIQSYEGEVAELSGGEPITGLEWTSANVTGRAGTAAVWSAPYDAGGAGLEAMRLRSTGRRVIRARYPNIVDPETIGARRAGQYEGWITNSKATWYNGELSEYPGVDFTSSGMDWPGVDWTDHMQMAGGIFTIGSGGGQCNNLANGGTSYWCGEHCPRGDTYIHRGPGGMINPDVALPNSPYKDPEGMIFHLWSGCPDGGDSCPMGNVMGPWFTFQWEVQGYGYNGPSNRSLAFAPGGGTQGSEGWEPGDGPAGPFFVENVLEELDAGNEFYYDKKNKVLYYAPNGTSTTEEPSSSSPPPVHSVRTEPPAADELIAVRGKVLISVAGTQNNPVKGVTVRNVVLRDSAPTYLDAHDLPSAGDWGLVHSAAVVAVGTEGFSMTGCVVTRADGQGVLLEGYHRNASLLNNDFEFVGSHAMVSWGKTSPCLNANCSVRVPGNGDGPDGRNGDQPIGTLVQGNIVHEVGIWERQGTMWNQALTAGTILKDNIFFNCDRASVNINDGFAGGNHLVGNLIFNTIRGINKDGGPFNSWDRVPYITTFRNGTPSIVPDYNRIYNNFVIANYYPDQGIDTDDGSSFYKVSENVIVYGTYGHKADFGAHDLQSEGNLYAYIDSSVTGWATNGHFANNTVVLAGSGTGGYMSDCGTIALPTAKISNNTIYAQDQVMMVECTNASNPAAGCSSLCKLRDWVARGHDNGTTLSPIPPDHVVMDAARLLLSGL